WVSSSTASVPPASLPGSGSGSICGSGAGPGSLMVLGCPGDPLRKRSLDVVVLAVETVEGTLGLVDALGDLVAVLALGLLVDQVPGLLQPAGDLVAVGVDGTLQLRLRVVQESH